MQTMKTKNDDLIQNAISNDLNYLCHYGVPGQRRGQHDESRRYQNHAVYARGNPRYADKNKKRHVRTKKEIELALRELAKEEAQGIINNPSKHSSKEVDQARKDLEHIGKEEKYEATKREIEDRVKGKVRDFLNGDGPRVKETAFDRAMDKAIDDAHKAAYRVLSRAKDSLNGNGPRVKETAFDRTMDKAIDKVHKQVYKALDRAKDSLNGDGPRVNETDFDRYMDNLIKFYLS